MHDVHAKTAPKNLLDKFAKISKTIVTIHERNGSLSKKMKRSLTTILRAYLVLYSIFC